MVDLSYDMSPLFNMLLNMVLWMVVPGIIVVFVFRKILGVFFRLILITAILCGAYAYFKIGMT